MAQDERAALELESFLASMFADFEERGPEAIVKARESRPDLYLKAVAALLPEEFEMFISEFEEPREREH